MCNLSGFEIVLISLICAGFIIKLRMIMNESRTNRFEFCHGCIVVEREIMDLEEQQENHDAMQEET